MKKEKTTKIMNPEKELKRIMINKKLFDIFYWILFLSPFAVFFTYLPLCKNVSEYMALFAFCISIMTAAVPIKTNYVSEYNTKIDKLSKRKVILINPKTILEIKKEIENYLDGELANKTIDKIELINTSVGANDNRKEGFIIYH